METLLVVAIAAGVGVLVYRLTAGGEKAGPNESASPFSGGTGLQAADDADPPQVAGASSVPERSLDVPEGYIPVSSGGPSWHARLGGAMGLVIAVAVGAIALAISLWALVALVSRLFSDVGSGAGA